MYKRFILLASAFCGICLFLCQHAQAQTFLEQLEATVRQQIDAATVEGGEELPSPAQPSPAAPVQPPSAVPAPIPAPNPAPNSTPTPSGSIYLGLEAENPVGGDFGVRVATVTEDSPAWRAGFKVGDRIQAVNGFAIASLNDMVEQLTKTRPGDTASFLVARAGRNLQLKAVLMDSILASQIRSTPLTVQPGWLGVSVNDLTEAFRRQFGIAVYRGAAVSGLQAGSPAAKAGIRAGDAIIEVDGTPIQSARDLTDWIATTRAGQRVQVLFYRGGFSQVAEFTLEPNPTMPARAPVMSSPAPATLPSAPPAMEPANAGLPSILSKPPVPETDVSAQSDMIQELERQNASLAKQLQDTQQRLLETERKLEQIMALLKDQ